MLGTIQEGRREQYSTSNYLGSQEPRWEQHPWCYENLPHEHFSKLMTPWHSWMCLYADDELRSKTEWGKEVVGLWTILRREMGFKSLSRPLHGWLIACFGRKVLQHRDDFALAAPPKTFLTIEINREEIDRSLAFEKKMCWNHVCFVKHQRPYRG